MRNGFLIYDEMRKYLVYIRKPLVIYDFAIAPVWIFLICEENLSFFFISVAFCQANEYKLHVDYSVLAKWDLDLWSVPVVQYEIQSESSIKKHSPYFLAG
jgi:hypothetical protein